MLMEEVLFKEAWLFVSWYLRILVSSWEKVGFCQTPPAPFGNFPHFSMPFSYRVPYTLFMELQSLCNITSV